MIKMRRHLFALWLSLAAAVPSHVGASPSNESQTAPVQAAVWWGDPRGAELIRIGLAQVKAEQYDSAAITSTKLKNAFPTEPARLVIDFATAVARLQIYEAAAIFTHMAYERPTRLSAPIPLLDRDQVRTLSEVGGENPLAVAKAILDSGWSDGPVNYDALNARRLLVNDALDRGDTAQATTVAAGITDPFLLRDMITLDRYRALWPGLSAHWGADLGLAVRADMARWQAAAAVPSPPPAVVLEQARWLLADDRANDAVALLLPAARHVLADASEKDIRFALIDLAAHALARVGRGDDGLALLDELRAKLTTNDAQYYDTLTLQTLILADLGRLAEARVHADEVDRLSSKSAKWLVASSKRLVVCAAADAADTRAAAAAMMVLRTAGPDPLHKAQALICMGDLDGAAAVLVDSFRAHKGIDVLRRLHRQPRPDWGRWHQRWAAAYARLADRPDVRAALIGYGRLLALSYPEADEL